MKKYKDILVYFYYQCRLCNVGYPEFWKLLIWMFDIFKTRILIKQKTIQRSKVKSKYNVIINVNLLMIKDNRVISILEEE